MKVSIVIPTFREAENIGALIDGIYKTIPDAKILVVDDTEDDSCINEVKAKNVPYIHRKGKGGRGSAVIDGVKKSLEENPDYIVEMDADFSHRPEQLKELVDTITKRNDGVVIASRYIKGGRIENWPASRYVLSFLANRVARFLLEIPIAEYTGGYRIYSRDAGKTIVETCGKYESGFIVLSEILVNLYYRGFTISEIPTVFVNRTRGESSVSMNELINALKGLFHIYLHKRRLVKEQRLRK